MESFNGLNVEFTLDSNGTIVEPGVMKIKINKSEVELDAWSSWCV